MYCVVICQKAKKEIPCFLQSLIQYVTLVGGEGLKEQRKFDDGWCFFCLSFFFFFKYNFLRLWNWTSVDRQFSLWLWLPKFVFPYSNSSSSEMYRKKAGKCYYLSIYWWFVVHWIFSAAYIIPMSEIIVKPSSILFLGLFCVTHHWNTPAGFLLFVVFGLILFYYFLRLIIFWKSEKKSKDISEHRIKIWTIN